MLIFRVDGRDELMAGLELATKKQKRRPHEAGCKARLVGTPSSGARTRIGALLVICEGRR